MQKFFNHIDSEAILQIPLSMSSQEDCWAWHHERNGLFTVCSAYRMMITAKKIREDYWEGSASCSNMKKRQKEWTQLWNMKLPPKIKIFCWRLALNSLPTGSVLKSRSMVDTAECRLCGADEDTWDHALLNCTSSKCIWAQLDEESIEVTETLSFPDPKHWVFFVCINFSQSDSIRILITCWAI